MRSSKIIHDFFVHFERVLGEENSIYQRKKVSKFLFSFRVKEEG